MRRLLKFSVCALFLSLALLGLSAAIQPSSAQTKSAKIDFKREIEPIFASACINCHGAKKAAGQLRLDSQAAALKGGLSGPSLKPGDAKASLLLQRIHGEGGQVRMPMGGDPLDAKQVELIAAWINQGAVWAEDGAMGRQGDGASESGKHWAYVKPVRAALPEVKSQAWVRNAIDAFVLARLEKEGWQPSPEADRATLARRVYLDITGLPPSVKELDAFLSDERADAYEKLVDRLLASPQYGERWARPWLDLARYADSNGYEKDNLRTAWKYRDWVINALNQDTPFDQFTIEQLAGDMLPSPTTDQLIATGFHRNTMVNQEGGIDPEEARYETLIDRVGTTATVWLGATLACAQCHNHKYDPFSQKDFFKMMAFFDNAKYEIGYQTPGADESRYVLEPQISLPTPEQETKRQALDAELKQLETKLKTQTPEFDAAQLQWEREILTEPANWISLEPFKAVSSGGATLRIQPDKSALASGAAAELETYTITTKTDLQRATALRIEALPDASLPKGGPGRDPYGNFLLTGVELEAAPANGTGQPQTIKFNDLAVDDSAYKVEQKYFFGWETQMGASDRPAGWLVNATNDPINAGRLPRQIILLADKPFGFSGGTNLTIKLKHLGGALNQAIGRFRLSVTTTETPKRIAAISARLRPILSIPVEQRTQKQRDDLSAQFRALTPLLKADRDRAEKLRDDLKALKIVTALVMRERESYDRPSTFFRERGAFLNKGDRIYAATPAVLPPLPDNAPVNRLGLARWLVDKENPLTSRVAVNRMWEQIFGRGLVETSEDFGTMGERPVNQALLDWLAVSFRDGATKSDGATGRRGDGAKEPITDNRQPTTAWSQKALIRLLVTSATYRQSSRVTPELQERDPYNRLLARGPRFRLEAEMIRDTQLTVSGLLSHKVGGPSVFPLQPEGIWKSPYSAEKWTTSAGEDRYRRSLYTFARRSAPSPAMMTFDATSREYCTVRRVRTNTPLQALTMLNDEAAMEAARSLAARMSTDAGSEPSARISYGFRSCTARAPKPRELARLAALYQEQLAYFAGQPAEAEKVAKGCAGQLNVQQFAALTMTANVLLNLDETLSKQ